MKVFTPVLAATLLATTTSSAQETSLRWATTVPAMMNVSQDVFHPWANRINEQGKGVLRIEVSDGASIASTANWFDRLLNDVQQVGWGILSFVPNKFNGTAVTGLPFEVDKAEHASAALFRLYKSGLLDADYNDTVPLILMALPQNALHFARAPARTFENLNGLKIASGSKVSTDVIAALGGAGISLITTEYYEGLQRRTVDGILTAWTAIGPFKLQEVTTYHIDTPLGGNQGGILMSKKRYESLATDARRVIDANAGEQMSRSWATYWDGLAEQGRALGKAQGHATAYLSSEQTAAWRKRIEPVTEEWVKATPNGRRLLDAYREFRTQVERGN